MNRRHRWRHQNQRGIGLHRLRHRGRRIKRVVFVGTQASQHWLRGVTSTRAPTMPTSSAEAASGRASQSPRGAPLPIGFYD